MHMSQWQRIHVGTHDCEHRHLFLDADLLNDASQDDIRTLRDTAEHLGLQIGVKHNDTGCYIQLMFGADLATPVLDTIRSRHKSRGMIRLRCNDCGALLKAV